MSYAGLLNSRADIYRPTIDAPTGPEPIPAWPDDPTYSSVPCRVQTNQVKELDKETGAVVLMQLAFFPYGTDLLEGDRVVIDSVTYDVQGVDADVAGARHHAEAMIKAVR